MTSIERSIQLLEALANKPVTEEHCIEIAKTLLVYDEKIETLTDEQLCQNFVERVTSRVYAHIKTGAAEIWLKDRAIEEDEFVQASIANL